MLAMTPGLLRRRKVLNGFSCARVVTADVAGRFQAFRPDGLADLDHVAGLHTAAPPPAMPAGLVVRDQFGDGLWVCDRPALAHGRRQLLQHRYGRLPANAGVGHALPIAQALAAAGDVLPALDQMAL